MRIAMAQLNPAVGALDDNLDKLLEAAESAHDEQADLLVFPAHALTGFPLQGLGESFAFLEDAREHLETFARKAPIPSLLSCMLFHDSVDAHDEDCDCTGECGHNHEEGGEHKEQETQAQGRAVAAELFLAGCGELESLGVPAFMEDDTVPVIRVAHDDIAVLLEDVFADETLPEDVDVLIELLAEPLGDETAACAARGDFSRMSRVASQNKALLVNMNLVGAADSHVFAGNSVATAPDGSLVHACAIDDEELFVVDTDSPTAEFMARATAQLQDCEIIWRALVLATRDYVRKNGFADVVLGLSGGIDSAVVATIAVDALGAAHVHGVLMPGPYSSQGSIVDAQELAENLGITTVTVPIDAPFDTFCQQLGAACGGEVDGLAAENLQARIRTIYLMTLSNTYGWMLLNTGNKSEASMGFSTLYGDTAGAYAPIGDIYKTEVYELAEWRASAGCSIPRPCIEKAPSAELYDGAKDADRLPTYDVLDAILLDHIEGQMCAEELIGAGHDAKTVHEVLRSVQKSEYKRRCEPIAPEVLGTPLTSARAWPITNGWVDKTARG